MGFIYPLPFVRCSRIRIALDSLKKLNSKVNLDFTLDFDNENLQKHIEYLGSEWPIEYMASELEEFLSYNDLIIIFFTSTLVWDHRFVGSLLLG